MNQQAHDYLLTVLPWPEAGETAYCNIHWMSLTKDNKKFWGGRAATNVQEALKLVEWAQKQPDIRDLYVCMSSQARCEERTSKRGYAYKNAVRSSQDAVALKSLYIDIDVKAGAYPTTGDAALALKQFISETGMPSPTAVVASGSGGMHVYWALDRALPPRDWQVLANSLVRAATAKGLKIDTQCTVDSARILRIPGTKNFKSDPPKEVKTLLLGKPVSLDDVRAVLGTYIDISPLPQVTGPKVDNSELSAGIEVGAKPVNIDEVATSCAFVKEALDTGGANYNNPLWFLTTSLAAFCEDGLDVAHRMAKGHPTYSAEETERLYNRVVEKRAQNNIGWPKCEKIELSGCTACATCPLRAQNKSPLNFTLKVAPAFKPAANVGTIDVLPDGYYRNHDGVIFRRVVGDDGTPLSIPVMPYPILDGWLTDSPWTIHFSTRVAGRSNRVSLALSDLASRDGLARLSNDGGIPFKDKADKIVREFLVSWVQKLQNTKNAVVSSTPFGWASVNGKLDGFSYAGRVWGVDADRPATVPNGALAIQYQPKGELQPWIDAAKLITDQDRAELNAMLAASFGAPLVRFTGQSGALMSAYSSESGLGKTTAMRVAQAVWADPIRAMQSLADTPNSVLNKLGEIKVLPLYWDELKTDADTAKFVNLTFTLTGGKEKSRLSSSVEQRQSGVWETLLISASNDSLTDPIMRSTSSTTAGLYRLFEFVVTPGVKGQIEHGVMSRSVSKLNENYGQAGLAYAQFLGANFERIENEVAQEYDRLSHELEAGNDERYWFVVLTTVLMGARYANELGLTEINEDGLREFMIATLKKLRSDVSEAPTDMKNTMSVSNILAQFLNAMAARHTLKTNKIHVGQGKPPKGSVKVVSDTSKLDGIYVHIGQDDRMLRISSTYLSRWMSDHGWSRHAFTKALKDEFGAKVINGKLGAGTDQVRGMEYIIELDMNDAKLQGFLE